MSSDSKEEEKPPDKIKSRKHRMNGFEQWGGYMASKKMKLAAQFDGQKTIETEEEEIIKSDIFKGISIYVNGYTKPSADELKKLMMIHGGTYHYYYSNSKTTHIVASNLPYTKIKNLKNQKVVKPDWITESIKRGKLLPYQNFLLYPPEFTSKQQTLKTMDCINLKASIDTISEEDKNQNKCDNKSASSPSFQTDNTVISESSKETLKSVDVQNVHFSSSSSTACSSFAKDVSAKVLSPSKSEAPVTAGHPAFLSEFYSHSRLHHISTAGQELKRYVQSLVDSHNAKAFSGREKLKTLVKNCHDSDFCNDLNYEMTERNKKDQQLVMHLDMDCFFVSVGLRKHPELKGKPVAVTHSKGKKGGAQDGSDIHFEASYYSNQSKKKLEGLTSADKNLSDNELINEEPKEKPKISKYSKEYGSLSEIASCSYEARKAGVRNGMFLGEALRRCPNLKTIPYDFEGYSEVSKQLYDIVASYTLDIEAVSCDELYIDCTELIKDTGISPLQFASILRAEIEQKTNCTASAGLGPNMLISRLANKVAKPNGQYFVPKEKIQEFVFSQKVKDIPGVGYTTSSKFEHLGVVTCADLQSWSLSKLQQEFGPKTGQTLYNRCRGKDNRVVQLQKERKSVSAEINYGIRFEKDEEVFKFLKELSVEVVHRLQNINCKGKLITLKLMVRRPEAPVQTAKFMGHGVCDHVTKSVALKSATDDANLIGQECCSLVRNLKIKPEDFRGIGIQLSKLESVQKDTKGYLSIENFITPGTSKSAAENDSNSEIFAPKDIPLVNKLLPKGSSVKDFLAKSSPRKLQPHPPQSIEELDQSVLNALPEDLQKEVLEMYSNKPTAKSVPSLQHSSPSTRANASASSKSTKASLKKSSSLHPAKNNKTPTKQNTLLNCMMSSKSNSSDDSQESVLKKRASIGGAENINEVRSLVKEWVLSSQVVLEEDIDEFRDYVLQVIDEDLKKVDLILKYFHRVVSTANALWQQAYLTILSYVQQKILQKYGTMLDARSDFV